VATAFVVTPEDLIDQPLDEIRRQGRLARVGTAKKVPGRAGGGVFMR